MKKKTANPKVIKVLVPQLQNVISLRTDEHQTWLKIFFASFTTNALLLIAIFHSEKFPDKIIDEVIISLFGILITIIIIFIQNRAFLAMKAYEDFSKVLEKKLKLKKYSYNKFRDKALANNKGQARLFIIHFNWFILFAWIAFLVYFVFFS
jgi:hypothetical protein